MAEEKVEGREFTWQQLFPWTQLFRGFQIALDLNKLFLAALGIFFMSLGWVFLATLFSFGWSKPNIGQYKNTRGGSNEQTYREFKQDLNRFNLMHETAGVRPGDTYEFADFAENYDEYDRFEGLYQKAMVDESQEGDKDKKTVFSAKKFISLVQADPAISANKARQLELVGQVKPGGFLAKMPFWEDRGPNPYLLLTGRARAWEKGGFGEWLVTKQVPVLIEPLIKMFRPVAYLFDSRADAWIRFYFFLVVVWTLGIWSLFGGAITRIAAVQIARGEKIGMFEALAFTRKRLLSYLTAPLFPLLLIFLLLIFMVIYGIFFLIPILGDIFVAGFFWPFMILFGLGIAIALIGLVGWPLMAATVSTEGTDSWEAFSRSYSYVFQRPWQYLWYGLVAVAYGAVVVFFIGFMGSFLIYLSKWGVSKTPGIDYLGRNPSFLFIYAPESFGWRNLLLSDATMDGQPAQIVDADGDIVQANYDKYVKHLMWWNFIGAGMVAFWVGLVFLLVLGFGYSFFWSTMTITYMLLRRSVDTAEMEEVYLEEEDQEGYNGPLAPPAAPAAPAAKPGPQMVEAPTLKPPPASPSTPVTAPATLSSAPAATTGPAVTEKPPEPAQTPAPEPKKDGAGGDSAPAP